METFQAWQVCGQMLGRVWGILDFPCPSSQPLLIRLGAREAVSGP